MAPGSAVEGGAMVISLDFELLWGVRDLYSEDDPYMIRVINERKVVPRILDLFEEYNIAATWAVVGMMMAQGRSELRRFAPKVKPCYTDEKLYPYDEPVGEGEWDDPLHYAHQLVREIQGRKRQEIATHTFSHYYCLEEGQNREAFTADLDSALSIANKYGIQIRSIVFPRNQYNHHYDEVLVQRGVVCYRGTENHRAYRVELRGHRLPHRRIYRLLDSCFRLSGMHLLAWEDIVEGSGLCNIASSRYLRPIRCDSSLFARLRLKRIAEAIHLAARSNSVFHLWAHPQDFGVSPDANLRGLREILEYFKQMQDRYGMVSLNMLEAATTAKKMGESRNGKINELG